MRCKPRSALQSHHVYTQAAGEGTTHMHAFDNFGPRAGSEFSPQTESARSPNSGVIFGKMHATRGGHRSQRCISQCVLQIPSESNPACDTIHSIRSCMAACGVATEWVGAPRSRTAGPQQGLGLLGLLGWRHLSAILGSSLDGQQAVEPWWCCCAQAEEPVLCDGRHFAAQL
jgi:hypothetical protein